MLGLRPLRARLDAAGPAGPAGPPAPVTLNEGADDRLAPAAAALAAHADGGRVLVVAAGAGVPAAAAAARAGHVVATERDADLRACGAALVPEAEWHGAGPGRLPFGDERFDAVLAYFGATYEPDPRAVASELTRVARPGATVAIVAWTGEAGRRVNAMQPRGGPRPGAWSRYETAYRLFFGFDGLDVVEHELPGVGTFGVVAGRRPRAQQRPAPTSSVVSA